MTLTFVQCHLIFGRRWQAMCHYLLEACSSHWRRQLWGTGARAPPPSTYNIVIFQCSLTYAKSNSDYMSTVASCKNSATSACAPPGTKSWRLHWQQQRVCSAQFPKRYHSHIVHDCLPVTQRRLSAFNTSVKLMSCCMKTVTNVHRNRRLILILLNIIFFYALFLATIC